MVLGLKVLLFLSLHLLQGVKSSMVHLNNNGYEGVVVAINPSVPEDERLIQSLKEMVTQASTYLFEATKGRFYFRNVSILIPITWKSKSEYLTPQRESYDKADIIVAEPYLKYGDEPYTLQYGQCGDRGQYIHFTPNFLLTDNLPMYGPRGRLFVHEWAHLRWGLFDEYNTDRPFYMSGKNTLEATRCSTGITGTNVVSESQRGSTVTRACRRDSRTGLYESKCTFIPNKFQTARDSIMFMQTLSSVVDFCTGKTHNTEAPNLQNKMCNYRSTWDVIKESADFQNASPMIGTEAPPPPTFSLLKSKQRVVCLVLDKSGSMNSEDHLIRMNQAAELYLTQIVEKESMVGLVTFDSIAIIQNYLTKITNSSDYSKIIANLPQQASGGTSICRGLEAGFQAVTSSGQKTSGSEIILLTDGEDRQISSCFEEVKHSGAIIHSIALGPSADKDLETLSTMTGGLRFYANKDITGLMDAFSGISSGSGDILQRALQLESKTLDIAGRKQISGTVPVDVTIGNDTFFVVTWTVQKPEIILQDPKGKKYETSEFKDDKLNIRSARLQIPGIAETGTWTYSLKNKNARSQLLTVTVTTRARSPTTLPVIATAHMSKNIAQYPSPLIVYARVSQGFLPVLGASVTAFIESEDGHQVTLELWDNGAGADTVKNDGIYTRYFTDYHGNGRYSLKVHVQARKNKARLSLRQQNKSLYIPGYIEDGKIIINPPIPEVPEATEAPLEDFSRLTSGGSFTMSGAPPGGNHAHVFPPCKVTDLEAEFKGDHIHLAWTAPGMVLDKGRAHRYVIRMSQHPRDLQEGFHNGTVVNTSGLVPKEAGSIENFKFKPKTLKTGNSTMFYIAVQAINEANLTSAISNIAQAVKFIPPEQEWPSDQHGSREEERPSMAKQAAQKAAERERRSVAKLLSWKPEERPSIDDLWSKLAEERPSMTELGSEKPEERPSVAEQGALKPEENPSMAELWSRLAEEIPSMAELGSKLAKEISSMAELGSRKPRERPSMAELGSRKPVETPPVPEQGALKPEEIPSMAELGSRLAEEISSMAKVESGKPEERPSVAERGALKPEEIPSMAEVWSRLAEEIPSIAELLSKKPGERPSVPKRGAWKPGEIPSMAELWSRNPGERPSVAERGSWKPGQGVSAVEGATWKPGERERGHQQPSKWPRIWKRMRGLRLRSFRG